MESAAESLMKEMGIPAPIIAQVLKITTKEEEAINLALEFMENPQPAPELPHSSSNPPTQPESKKPPVVSLVIVFFILSRFIESWSKKSR